ncbi:tRNA (adenosine(37)-N6)-threonylcarbamoyltransferase complex ATPase subunit type 1 TsaE [Bacillus horti]|uniref:tRNA threonylcarbamoyladenosine biosynthesis protein TsaE n=1 Tax=Caldalkalibacillus horti TaxID=77523 RepID=A0ABT9W4W6_9BACI|nr:tRNA threonylcarbamoyladenosine biosynthesis protein TsaE [Bacillus horti]
MDNPQFKYISESPEDTARLAEQLAQELKGGEVITLTGDLGAGKTRFTQGLAVGLGIKKQVNSPTFTLIKEYHGESLALYHMDVYRIEDEFEELGFDEYFYGDGVAVIEWPQQIEAQLPQQRLEINILKISDNQREVQFHAKGSLYEQLLTKVMKK